MIGRRDSNVESNRGGTGAPTLALLVALGGAAAAPALAQPAADVKRIIAFGAHPDDCSSSRGASPPSGPPWATSSSASR